MPTAGCKRTVSNRLCPNPSPSNAPGEEASTQPQSPQQTLYPISRYYHKTHKPSSPWTHFENQHLIANRLVGFTWTDISKHFQLNRFNKTDADCMHQARSLYESDRWMEVIYDYASDNVFPLPPRYMVDGSDRIKHRWYCRILAEVRRQVGQPGDKDEPRVALPGPERIVLVFSVEDRRGLEVLFEFGDLKHSRADTAPHVAKDKTVR